MARLPLAHVAIGFVLAAAAILTAISARAGDAVFPTTSWERIDDPRAAGWSPAGLEKFRQRLATTETAALLAVYRGRVLFEYGDVHTPNYLASERKSLLSTLYGNYVASGKIRLDATLADLGIDDIGGLSAKEKEATVRDRLTARSGVYHPAANMGDELGKAPPRNSQKHGTYFLYNNWDFNALGTIFEQQTGQNLYDAFERDLARPLRMEDFRRSQQHKAALVPRDWTKTITHVVTPAASMNPAGMRKGPLGYGYLWWVWDSGWAKGAWAGAFTAHGMRGQHLTVLPTLDLVIAHATPWNAKRPISHDELWGILDVLIGAKCRAAGC